MQRLLIFLAILYPSIGFASNCSDCISVGVDYLFMKPSVYDPYFVIPEGEGEDEPHGTRFGNLFSYHSGVRMKGMYNLCYANLALYVEGLYLADTAKRSLSFPNEQALGTKGETSLDIDDLIQAASMMRYRLGSVTGGFRYCFDVYSPFLVFSHLSIQYANLRMREKIHYINSGGEDNFYDASMHGWGIGPEARFDVGFQISSCLTFIAQGSYALLVGKVGSSSGSREVSTAGVIIDDVFASNDKRSVVCPVTEFKLGFNYAFPFNCFVPILEIGYDILCYNNMLDHIRWCGDASTEGISFDHFTPFMVHGLYVSLSASF